MLDPVFPRLTGTCCTAWGWSRRRVRRVSYLSPRAEIVVVFLAEGVQDIKVAGKKTFFSCEISFVGVIFLSTPSPASTPSLSLSIFIFVSAVTGEVLCEREQIIYLSGLSVCDCVSFFFILFCFGDKWESRRGNRSKHGVTQSRAMMSGALCLLSQQRGRGFLN